MRRSTHWLTALLLVALAPLPRLAQAACSFAGSTGMTRVQFDNPASITIPNNAAPGTVLWTSAPTPQDADVVVDCGTRTDGGIVNHIGTPPAGGSTTFPIGYIPGLAYRLIRSGSGHLVASPADYLTAGETTFSRTTQLELVVTGPIANGSALGAVELGRWEFGGLSAVTFQTRGITVLKRPACSVSIDPTVVNLRAVTSSELQGNGTTAADTPFAIQLNCAAATQLDIELDATNPVHKNQGVLRNIASGAGAASGVAVQITRQDGTPVKLKEKIRFTTSNGPYAIPFAARYYRTGGTLAPGLVKATATYTLTYP